MKKVYNNKKMLYSLTTFMVNLLIYMINLRVIYNYSIQIIYFAGISGVKSVII